MATPNRSIIVCALLALALLLAACGGDGDTAAAGIGDDDTTPTADDTPAAEPAPTDVPDPTPTAEQDPTAASQPTATPEPTEAPVEPPEDDEADPDPASYDFAALSPVVEAFIEDNGLNGAGLVIVERDDGVIHHEHWGEFDEDRISLVASSSKMITAGVLLHLDDAGLLDIDAPVADAVEWGAANPNITPAQLISNSSGLVGLLPNPAYPPYVCQYLAGTSLQDCGEAIFTTPDDDADIVKPDSEFRYGGGQWQVAGAIAEAVAGKSWAELIDEIYVQPCELEVLAYNNHFTQLGSGGFDYPAVFDSDPTTLFPTDNPNMGAGAYVTTGDYAKLLLMHLRGGVCGDTQVLSPEALGRMHGDRIADAYGADAWDPNTGYGMGWWVDRQSGHISDGGAYGSQPWLDLEDGYGAFLVIEALSQLGRELADQLDDLIEEAIVGQA
jgi:CubicO group peptidase (beta-lactamase class C family)